MTTDERRSYTYSAEKALARFFELSKRNNWPEGRRMEMTASGHLENEGLVSEIRRSTGWSDEEATIEIEHHRDDKELEYTAVAVTPLEKRPKTDDN